MTIKISLGLPVYNEEECLDDTLKSIRAQTFENYELIISDNNSDDNSLKIINKYSSDNRIKVIKNTQKIGMIDNFNLVLNKSSSDYFIWIGAHDLYLPNFLEKLVENIKKNKNFFLIYTDISRIDKNGNEIEIHKNIGFNISNNYFLRMLQIPWKIKNSGDLVYGIFDRKKLIKFGTQKNILWWDVLLIYRIFIEGNVYKINEPLRKRRYFGIKIYKNWNHKYVKTTRNQRNNLGDKVSLNLLLPNLTLAINLFLKIGFKKDIKIFFNIFFSIYIFFSYLIVHRKGLYLDIVDIFKK